MNWKHGDDVIIAAAVSDEDAKEKFPKGLKAVKPYLRVTPSPTSRDQLLPDVLPAVVAAGRGGAGGLPRRGARGRRTRRRRR